MSFGCAVHVLVVEFSTVHPILLATTNCTAGGRTQQTILSRRDPTLYRFYHLSQYQC